MQNSSSHGVSLPDDLHAKDFWSATCWAMFFTWQSLFIGRLYAHAHHGPDRSSYWDGISLKRCGCIEECGVYHLSDEYVMKTICKARWAGTRTSLHDLGWRLVWKNFRNTF